MAKVTFYWKYTWQEEKISEVETDNHGIVGFSNVPTGMTETEKYKIEGWSVNGILIPNEDCETFFNTNVFDTDTSIYTSYQVSNDAIVTVNGKRFSYPTSTNKTFQDAINDYTILYGDVEDEKHQLERWDINYIKISAFSKQEMWTGYGLQTVIDNQLEYVATPQLVELFNVKFYDYYDNLIQESNVRKGGYVTPPEIPQKIGNATFNRWEPSYTYIDKDVEIRPIYDIDTINLTFKGFNGSNLGTYPWTNGEGFTPQAEERNGQQFIGWQPKPSKCTEDTVVVAQYLSTEEVIKQAFQNAYRKELEVTLNVDGTDIVLTNDDFVAESMTITQSLCEEQQLRFGKCNASEFSIQTLRTDIQYKGKTLIVKMKVPDFNLSINLGTYYVVNDKFSDSRNYKTITAYDWLYIVNATDVRQWYDAQFTTGAGVTLKALRDSFFAEYRLSQANTQLPLDDIVVFHKADLQGLTGGEFLQQLCEVNGCFGYVNFANIFTYVFPSTNMIEHALTPDDYMNCTHDDFEVQKVTRLQFMSKTAQASSGWANNNMYVVKNNMFFETKDTYALFEMTQLAFYSFENTKYVPFKSKQFFMPYLEIGDSISITSLKGETIKSYILKRTISGINGVFDEFDTKGKEFYSDVLGAVDKQQQKTEQQIDEVETKADESYTKATQAYEKADQALSTSLKCVSVAQLPSKPEANTIYLIQGSAG